MDVSRRARSRRWTSTRSGRLWSGRSVHPTPPTEPSRDRRTAADSVRRHVGDAVRDVAELVYDGVHDPVEFDAGGQEERNLLGSVP